MPRARDSRGRFTSRRTRRPSTGAFPSRRLTGPFPTGDDVSGVVTGETVTLGGAPEVEKPSRSTTSSPKT